MGDAPDLLEREEPRGRLEAALAQARRGHGRLVSVEGEAGIGKTSLVLSFADAHRGDARVHVGGCEQLSTPEPLGPLRDVARESQGRFQLSSSGQFATFEALLRLLTGGRGPALLVIEDLHWADDATLDLLRYLGRRIAAAPVLVAVTCRNDEPGSQARLASLWTDMPRDARERIDLRPLSLDAVSALAGSTGRSGQAVFAATGGNPFHVTEYLAAEDEAVPRTVQDATLARAARLSRRARRVLDCAAISPRRIREESLRILADDADHSGVEECLAAGMLSARGEALAFRHELARRAIHDAMAPLRRRELHAAALALLKGRNDVGAAEVAHHADQAAAAEDLVAFSIRAAEEATALGAHREALEHLKKALAAGTWLSNAERAALLEAQAEAGDASGAFDAADRAIDQAIAAHRRAGDVLGLGNALRIAARLAWQHGDTGLAERRAREALETLAGHLGTLQHVRALAGWAQISMLSDRHDAAIADGTEAMGLAQRLGRGDVYLHALTSVALSRTMIDPPEGIAQMAEAIEEARRRGELDALPRLYGSMTRIMAFMRIYPGLFEAIDAGLEAAAARDNSPLEGYLRGARASALIDLGRLEEGAAEAAAVVQGPYPKGPATFSSLVGLSRVRVRAGVDEGGALDQVRTLPAASRDNMRRAPIAVADAEAAWLGLPRPGAMDALRMTLASVVEARSQPWLAAELALWLAILGEPPELPAEVAARLPAAHRLHVAGRWREAADAWAALGCPYEQAIALMGGDEAGQREALAIFDRLGATPAAGKLRRDMRAAGVRSVPSGPRSVRKADIAGLTRRQGEVLELLGQGLSNIEISERLKTSPKTVEHHVGAILAAFDAPSRLRAVQIARQQGRLP